MKRRCGYYDGTAGAHCGAVPARGYPQGPRCRLHTPSAVAGRPEPPATVCAPLRCYCGSCPSWLPASAHPAHADYGAVVYARAIATGKRRASLREYRDAQAAVARPTPSHGRTAARRSTW